MDWTDQSAVANLLGKGKPHFSLKFSSSFKLHAIKIGLFVNDKSGSPPPKEKKIWNTV